MTKTILTTFICLCSLFASAQTFDSLRLEAMILKNTLEKRHYLNKKVDDVFSKQLFLRTFKNLDPKEIYFTQNEISQLSMYENTIDDELNGEGWNFIPKIAQKYRESLLRAKGMITEISQKPLDFTTNDFLYLSLSDSINFSSSVENLKKRWIKVIKSRVLEDLFRNNDSPNLVILEPILQQKVCKNQLKKIDEALNINEFSKLINHTFLETLSTQFDPHTVYLSSAEAVNFVNNISVNELSFGIVIEEDDKDNIIIGRLIPGGPAWKTNELNKGDILLKIKTSSGKNLEVEELDFDEIEGFLALSEEKRIEITVRKPNGIQKTVSLEREQIRDEENIVKSFILNGEKKVGYISLPGFYTEWENFDSKGGCANDLAKEIIKLKQENIEGIILDIRNNFGGSMQEGMELAGIFIDEGPLAIVKDRTEKVSVLKDPNRGTVYDGPLVVLINGQSASASEFLAGALQDYKRAIILGSNSFGKASMQTFVPVDSSMLVGKKRFAFDLGFSLTTIGRFYRLNGKSSQIVGVKPDVQTPSVFEKLTFREANYLNPLPSDSIIKKTYFTPYTYPNFESLIEKSKKRISQNPHFSKRIEHKKIVEVSFSSIPLNFITHKKFQDDLKLSAKRIENESIFLSNSFRAENSNQTQSLLKIDSFTKEINESLIKKIQSDIEIEEAYFIIYDWLKK